MGDTMPRKKINKKKKAKGKKSNKKESNVKSKIDPEAKVEFRG